MTEQLSSHRELVTLQEPEKWEDLPLLDPGILEAIENIDLDNRDQVAASFGIIPDDSKFAPVRVDRGNGEIQTAFMCTDPWDYGTLVGLNVAKTRLTHMYNVVSAAERYDDNNKDIVATEIGALVVADEVERDEEQIANNNEVGTDQMYAQAVAELRSEWGVSEEIPISDIVHELDIQTDEIATLRTCVSSFRELQSELSLALHMEIGGNSGRLRSESLLEFAGVIDRMTRISKMVETGKALAPQNQRKLLQSVHEDLLAARSTARTIADQMSARESVGDMAGMAHRRISATESIPTRLSMIEQSISDMRTRLAGKVEVHTIIESDYINETIDAIAAELQDPDITEEKLLINTLKIERLLNESIVKGETPYPDRVVSDSNKSRNAIGHIERGKEVNSRTYVSEIATDMLAGKFVAESNPDLIVIDKNGAVELSQHRASALMLLYGKNWQQFAPKYGIRIERK